MLTNCYNCRSPSASPRGSTTESQKESQPTEALLAPVAVEVGSQVIGSVPLGQLASIRRVADGNQALEPAGSGRDWAAVHKGVEAGLSAIRALTALSNASEGKGRDVQGGIVDCGTTGTSACEDCSSKMDQYRIL